MQNERVFEALNYSASRAISKSTMQTPFEFMIGLTYTRRGRRGRRKDGFMSFISGMSVASIALGVAALIIVLSVMNGFQKEVRDRMLSVIPHVEIRASKGALTDVEGVERYFRRKVTWSPLLPSWKVRGSLVRAPLCAAQSSKGLILPRNQG